VVRRYAGIFGRIASASRARAWLISSLLVAAACALNGCGPSWSPVEKDPGTSSPVRLTKDGYYRVRRGDSLYTIAFGAGLDWRDLAEWNGIRAPYTIYPDQELRMTPPPVGSASQVVIRPAKSPAATVSTDQKTASPEPSQTPAPRAAVAEPKPTAPASQSAAVSTAATEDPGSWRWPTEGRLLSTFQANDPSRNGIEIGGKEGQPIMAAAAGEVVYSGNGLIGYGELIIVKHSDRMLSAYAHNRKRLVTEGQKVASGEQLAEMGRDDRNQAMLHFEIRVNGTPQNPMKFLPRR
jgi:lipoprotein NlpD